MDIIVWKCRQTSNHLHHVPLVSSHLELLTFSLLREISITSRHWLLVYFPFSNTSSANVCSSLISGMSVLCFVYCVYASIIPLQCGSVPSCNVTGPDHHLSSELQQMQNHDLHVWLASVSLCDVLEGVKCPLQSGFFPTQTTDVFVMVSSVVQGHVPGVFQRVNPCRLIRDL